MARKRHSPESIAAVLRKAESGIPVAQLARQAGVHENTPLEEKVRPTGHRGDSRDERAAR
ncbi:MAG: transposase [Vulcanimicrobiaceae bacterium]